MVFPGHTHLHFGNSLFITIKINQFICVSCLTVCQYTQTVNYLTTIIAIADLCKIWKTNDIKTTSWCAFQRCFRTQLIGCMHISGMDSKHF